MNASLVEQVIQQSPGALKAPGDTLLHGLDTLAGAATALRDTLSQAPLPGGVAAFVRFVFQVPSWIQIAGAVVGAIVAIGIVAVLWRRRATWLGWLKARASHVKLALGLTATVALALLAFGGVTSWNYMQHDNGFCTGCHIMERPFRRFGAGAGKHEELKCHDCHQQSLYASARQMVLWVADRPQKIGVHAPVPNGRCESCHQIADSKKPYQHALFLAGHKVHFGSDSASLKDLSCAKCHGAEIHRFVPSAGACQQSGCHEEQKIRLGAMAKLPAIKCTTCHAFTADIPALASRDSAVRALIPSQLQCRACHGMEGKPTGYIAAKDPHKGLCGSCHDVHRDSLPSDAKARCTTCHNQLERSAFHGGANHKRIQAQCLTCHVPHAASVDASDCVGCHTAVRKRGLFQPPLPFDTNTVIRRRIGVPTQTAQPVDGDEPDHRGKGDAPPDDPPPLAADSFPHPRHAALPCLTCHAVNTSRRLVFEIPRGCDLCHHQSIMAGAVNAADCNRCHAATALAVPRVMTVAVRLPRHEPVARPVAFRHEVHQGTPCSSCHQSPNTVPPDSVRNCTACHESHHAEGRTCTACHSRAETPAAHSRTTHVRCDECHAPARIAALNPSRNFCLTCHLPQKDHQPQGECSTCHFLEAPAQFRARLMTQGSE